MAKGRMGGRVEGSTKSSSTGIGKNGKGNTPTSGMTGQSLNHQTKRVPAYTNSKGVGARKSSV